MNCYALLWDCLRNLIFIRIHCRARVVSLLIYTAPEGFLAAYDTEGVVFEEIEFLGQPAFIRENQGVAYFVWQQDGQKCSVVANLPINKVVEIANSVSTPKY